MQERHSLSKTDKNHKMAGNLPAVSVEPGFYDQPRKSGDGGIRTLVPRRANAFRVRPVMTTSIQLHMIFSALTDIFLIIAFLLEKSSDNSP